MDSEVAHGLVVPSPEQAALAIAVLKSKPCDISVRRWSSHSVFGPLLDSYAYMQQSMSFSYALRSNNDRNGSKSMHPKFSSIIPHIGKNDAGEWSRNAIGFVLSMSDLNDRFSLSQR
jgi:hypothetical protein